MLVDSRRGLVVSGLLMAGGFLVGLLVVLPATAPVVQAMDDAVRRRWSCWRGGGTGWGWPPSVWRS